MSTIVSVDTRDIRFPTSLELDGSDAMNPDPDYSAAYVAIRTDAEDGLEGHAFVFTIGRGNDVQVAALDTLRGHLVGRDVEELLADMGAASRLLMHDSQLRWLGPEKGVMHMAIGAIVNALWDLRAKRAGQPLWLHLSTPQPRGARLGRRLPLPERCAHARAGARDPAGRRTHAPGAHRPPARGRLPRLHDHAGLARLLRREARPPVPRGRGRRLPADQAQGRREPRRRHPSPRHRACCGRARLPDRHRLEPALGRGRRHRLGERARRLRPRLDRGADESG